MKTIFIPFIFVCSLFAEWVSFEKIVLDKDRKLMWQDDQEIIYQEDITMAKVYCEALILSGYTDWKLPTIKELQSIVDIQNPKGFIQKEFQNIQPKPFWSDTPFVGDPKEYWYVDFQSGKTAYQSKENPLHVRCVRGHNE